MILRIQNCFESAKEKLRNKSEWLGNLMQGREKHSSISNKQTNK